MKKYYKQHPQPFVLLENYKPPVVPAPAVGDDNGNAQPVRPVREVFIFDGDETKLMPGMRVKISSGTLYELPTIPDNPKLQKKACTKFRQKVRDLVENDAKYKAIIAVMNNVRKE
uniref:Uncharacterized protein n=1 Tax=Panagrolaimus davidi TaxID=227884 RepID=A0A914Q568_9BILA